MKKMSELGKDVSVQWCDYDPSFVEEVVPVDGTGSDANANTGGAENSDSLVDDPSSGVGRKLASTSARLVSAVLRMFGI